MNILDPVRVGALIGSVYEAALDATRWPAFLERLASSLDAGGGMIWMHDFRNSSADLQGHGSDVSATVRMGESALASYASHYSGCNVWAANEAVLAEGATVTSSMLYPDRLLERTEFCNDWLGPQNLFYALGGAVIKQDTRSVKLSFMRSKRAGEYSADEFRLMEELMPHLQRAVELHRRLYKINALSASAMAVLDMLPWGVVLLNSTGTVLHANRGAHRLSRETAAISFGERGAVCGATASATATIDAVINSVVQTGLRNGTSPGGALRLKGAKGSELQILVSPLPGWVSPFGEQAAGAIFLNDPHAKAGRLVNALQVMYRMTPAEAKLTESLVNGHSLKAYAEKQCRTINTVRSQLRSATTKVGAKRQADLVRIVLTGPIMVDGLTSVGERQE